MICLPLVAFGTLLSAMGFVEVTEAEKAKILLHSVNDELSPNAFELNTDVLKEISLMKRPIRVIAAVGNSRVGKSTFLNLITCIFNHGAKTNAIEEVFESGATLDPVTRGVWAHVIQHPDKNGSILLLDVEGTDLGNDRITDRLSMFTAMLSSGLNIFALQVVKNGDIDFLYRIARLSELVFESEDITNNFPRLRIILRTDLDVPDDDSFEDDIRQKMFQSNGQSMGKGKNIQKYFPKDRITVSHIPSVNNPSELFTDISQLRESSGWKLFEKLLQKMKDSPVKNTSTGHPIDGEALRILTIKLVEAMNSPDSWKDFGSVYVAMERYICTKRYEKYIKPVLLRHNSSEMEDDMFKALDKFEEECSLPGEIAKVKEELIGTLKEKRKREEEEKERQEERRKRSEEREREEERRKWEEGKRREEEWRRREVERRWEEERRRLEDEKRRLEEEKRKLEGGGWLVTVAKYVGTLFAGYFLSDEDLKDNITTLLCSEFNDIGLRGVCWEWNENAQRTFGLTGEDCGVIAQEVKVVYPWAVAEGMDGYLRVHYGVLHEMINVTHSNRNSSLLS